MIDLKQAPEPKRYTAEARGWTVSVYESALGGYRFSVLRDGVSLHAQRSVETIEEAAAMAEAVIAAMWPVLEVMR